MSVPVHSSFIMSTFAGLFEQIFRPRERLMSTCRENGKILALLKSY